VIYVLVPVRDEAATVGLLLWKVRQVFAAFEREYQLLVVDDASTDGTDEVLAPYARALPLTLVTHQRPQGYGRSLEELLRLAVSRSDRPRRDIAVTLQADFSESPDDLPDLIRRIESGADLVLADARNRPGMTVRERLARRLAPAGVRLRARLPGAGAGIGTLRAYRVGTVARMLRGHGPVLRTDGWAADLELLARAATVSRRTDVVVLSSRVPLRQRPSRATPLRSAWEAVRASGAFRTLRDDGAGHPEHEASPDRSASRAAAGRPEKGAAAGRSEREGRSERDGRGGRDGRGERDGTPPRRERVAAPPRSEGAEEPAVAAAERPARRGRGRRGGRGRGRRNGPRQEAAPPAPPAPSAPPEPS